jgi:UDP-glucose 4-epimerase
MRVLITGGAGFIGSHLAELLAAEGDEVVLFDNLSTGSPDNIRPLVDSGRAKLVIGDVCDRTSLAAAGDGCDIVHHLAAAVGVELILQRPLASMRTNLRGIENVLELAAQRSQRVLFTSSSEVYGNAASGSPMRETGSRTYGSTDIFRWAYAGAKAMGETLALAYHRELGVEVVVVRLFNVSGPRQSDSHGMVVPRFVRQAMRGAPITVFGDGRQSRAFAHVADIVEALARLVVEPAASGAVFNLGADREITITDLARLVRRATASRSAIVHVPYAEAYPIGFEEIHKRRPDLSRARDVVGFDASRGIDEIVRDIVLAERAFGDGRNSHCEDVALSDRRNSPA